MGAPGDDGETVNTGPWGTDGKMAWVERNGQMLWASRGIL